MRQAAPKFLAKPDAVRNYWFAQIGDAALSIIAPLAFAIGAN
jgi:hypothetical protein